MGMFDTYGDTQLKVGDLVLNHYKIGDKVDIPDGVYFAPDGVVCIHGGIFVAETKDMYDKYGNKLTLRGDYDWEMLRILFGDKVEG